MRNIIISLISHVSALQVFLCSFSSYNPITTTAGLNRQHRSKSLSTFALWNAGQKPRANTNGTEKFISLSLQQQLGLVTSHFRASNPLLKASPTATWVIVPNTSVPPADLKGTRSPVDFGTTNLALFPLALFLRRFVIFKSKSKTKTVICKSQLENSFL